MNSKEVKLCERSVKNADGTESISFGKDLCMNDIMRSRDDPSFLARQGKFTEDEKNIILKGFDEIEGGANKEDVHVNFKAALTDLVGGPYKKLHTVHCTNSKVCTDFRLRCRDSVDNIVTRVENIELALKTEGLKLIVSGCINLQRAQPVSLQHLFLAFVKQLAQYAGRLLDCKARMNLCPLLACMLMASKALEFSPTMGNRANRGDKEGSAGGNGTPRIITRSRVAVVIIGGVVVFLVCKTCHDIRREIVGAIRDWKEAGFPALVNIKIEKFSIY